MENEFVINQQPPINFIDIDIINFIDIVNNQRA